MVVMELGNGKDRGRERYVLILRFPNSRLVSICLSFCQVFDRRLLIWDVIGSRTS